VELARGWEQSINNKLRHPDHFRILKLVQGGFWEEAEHGESEIPKQSKKKNRKNRPKKNLPLLEAISNPQMFWSTDSNHTGFSSYEPLLSAHNLFPISHFLPATA
jgi:hypothetical protein